MILYLHIGTEKTGTTSIQRFFATNRERLAQNGILYPLTPGRANHLALATYATKWKIGDLWRSLELATEQDYQSFRPRLRDDLAAEIASQSAGKTIMSNEHCSSRLTTVEEIEDLRQMLSGIFDDIYVLVYLRRQDDFVVSTYSTGVKSGHSHPLTFPGEEDMSHRYDYWKLLSLWSQVFGRDRIICRKFEKGALVNNDVVADALHTLNVEPRPEYERPEDANLSLDATCLEFLRLLSKHSAPDWKLRRTVAALLGLSSGPLMDLPQNARRRLMKAVRASNGCVAREYFGGELLDSDDPLFRPRSDTRARTSDPGLDAEKAVAIAATLIAQRAVGPRAPTKKKRNLETPREKKKPVVAMRSATSD